MDNGQNEADVGQTDKERGNVAVISEIAGVAVSRIRSNSEGYREVWMRR